MWGTPYKAVETTTPKPPKTEYANPACYMHSTNDCSTKISGEHYISENILRQFGPRLIVSGMPWQPAGQETRYGAGSLTANILCDRHNSALSPLDAAAGRFFRELGIAYGHVTKRSLSTKTSFFLSSGEALESWAFKTLLGLYHGGISQAEGRRLVDRVSLDEATPIRALSGQRLKAPLGTYVQRNVGATFGDYLRCAPLISKASGVLAGLRLDLRAVTFDFLIDEPEAAFYFRENANFHRPTVLDLVGRQRTSRFFLSWTPLLPPEIHRVGIELGL
ncbi:hypothetical protein [Mesorhizobium australicum]|uniref:hypothetical protein n=1 Tax=Mesorhizobium australicum TaxID=536018 RepID=UPI00333ABCFB